MDAIIVFLKVWAWVSGIMFVVCGSGLIHEGNRNWKRWLAALTFAVFIPVIWAFDQFGTLYTAYFKEN